MNIRDERPDDADAVRQVNERAFGGAEEASIVDTLRDAGAMTLALVAELPASRFGLRWEHPCSDEAFMAMELQPGFLGSRPGIVRYRREFAPAG